MANNRLYIYDPEENEAFMLGKTNGDGWFISPAGGIDNWQERLNKWFEFRDQPASYGNATETSRLRLLTEYELPPDCKEE